MKRFEISWYKRLFLAPVDKNKAWNHPDLHVLKILRKTKKKCMILDCTHA